MSSLNEDVDESNHIFYDPVTLLRPVSRAISMNLDQLNFVTVLLLSFGLGYWFRVQFCDASRTTRAAVTTSVGLIFTYFCYGNAIAHLFINGFGSYLLMVSVPPQHVHKSVFAFAMGYLVLIHSYRWMYQKTYCLDVTGSMMVAVGKITLLASAITDGMGRDPKALNSGQKRDAVKEVPSLLDFASYMFNFQTVIVGPMNHYSTWSAFLELKHVPKNEKTGKPYDPTSTAMKKFEAAIAFSVVYTILGSYLPMSLTNDPSINEYNLLIWWLITVAASTVHRLPYYFAWTISDSICNISGFGYDGLADETLEPKWSRTTNVKPLLVEFGQNYKEMVDNWNIWTVAWLRRVVYERVEGPYRTLAVYVTGAAWHGLAVGYYFSFLTSALFTLSAATFRRCMRHRFLGNSMHKLMYDIFGMLVSKFAIGYIHWPFYVMHFWPSLFMYRKLLMIPHFIALFIYLYLPQIFSPQPKSKITGPNASATSVNTDRISEISQRSSSRTSAIDVSTRTALEK
ncbi:Membrane Bound O-Acyl transferase, MBOAT [Caenorhabditis elegans]|uniref:Membrane Bound O-Acyl transferase, MBOAT n=1 Tax=Caenorhabditis elegans TaxID=6239 RepID=H9G2W5_CAEEL|nr:Membrane Bound O-Acyl transferase, MBOAT [Caenorhabditis elegans]CCG28249.1 Membrane Bound O-Acyl transferase, MBOAT [Caenorhabditis elegans]|eukprot:NP_001255544.1 Membrane Bound O-Acyl transferase, MBOAT [Caenorhabditis elegans]